MRTYLFDLDGTLAASEPLKARALAHACASYGVEANHMIYADVMGADWKTVRGHFFETYRLNPVIDEFDERFRDLYLDLIEAEITETRGATQFLRKSRKQGIRIGLVSSAAPWMVERVLSKLDLIHAFDLVVTQEDVTSHKPDPEAYLLALSRLRASAEETLVFEDSSAGLKAASAAGCCCIAVRHAFNSKHDFSAAIRVIEGFNEFSDQAA
jgi:HAD superfamily hydrolase (TIGR01509 family)